MTIRTEHREIFNGITTHLLSQLRNGYKVMCLNEFVLSNPWVGDAKVESACAADETLDRLYTLGHRWVTLKAPVGFETRVVLVEFVAGRRLVAFNCG